MILKIIVSIENINSKIPKIIRYTATVKNHLRIFIIKDLPLTLISKINKNVIMRIKFSINGGVIKNFIKNIVGDMELEYNLENKSNNVFFKIK